MDYQSFDAAVAQQAGLEDLTAYMVERLNHLHDGEDVEIDFVAREDVGYYCGKLGFASDRNWGALELDQIAPTGPEGVQVVPEAEARAILGVMRDMIAKKLIKPSADGSRSPHLLNDFLPTGESFEGEPCLGHLWEFAYALAVELEHGTTRGTNVTNNHPLLTGMVVLAHLAEDTLYYARLWAMETEGELFGLQLSPVANALKVKETVTKLNRARRHREARIAEKLGQ